MFCPRSGGIAGGGTVANTGMSAAVPQKPPVQMGKSGFPCSNSIQTCEPMGGTMKHPAWIPAAGTHGMAQLDGISPSTSGTCAMMRPISMGSILLITVPRYFPKNFLGSTFDDGGFNSLIRAPWVLSTQIHFG